MDIHVFIHAPPLTRSCRAAVHLNPSLRLECRSLLVVGEQSLARSVHDETTRLYLKHITQAVYVVRSFRVKHHQTHAALNYSSMKPCNAHPVYL